MESGYAVALFEFCYAFADFVDDARYVIALIDGFFVWHPFWPFPVSLSLVKRCSRGLATWYFPVFGIAAREDNFGYHLIWAWLGDWDVLDGDLRPFANSRLAWYPYESLSIVVPNDSFLHGGGGGVADLRCNAGDSFCCGREETTHDRLLYQTTTCR